MKIYLSLSKNSFFVILLFISTQLGAQDIFSFHVAQDSTLTPPKELSFHLSNANFLKNNEYFNKTVEGYTLFGYWMQPKLDYQITEEISISAGGHFSKYFGLDNFSEVTPYYNCTFAPNKTFKIEIGSLALSENPIPSPIIATERNITSPHHEGLRISYDDKRIVSNTWIEWEDFLFHNEDKQEVINLFTYNSYKIIDFNQLSVSVPFIFAAHHKGGQINKEPKAPLIMVANNAAGVHIIVKEKKTALELEYYFCGYADKASVDYSAYKNGSAHFISTKVTRKNLFTELTFFDSNQYISANGNMIYNAKGNIPEAPFQTENKELFTGTVGYRKVIAPAARLSAGATLFHDPQNPKTDYYYWFILSIDLKEKLLQL